jgi:hypothetical protein
MGGPASDIGTDGSTSRLYAGADECNGGTRPGSGFIRGSDDAHAPYRGCRLPRRRGAGLHENRSGRRYDRHFGNSHVPANGRTRTIEPQRGNRSPLPSACRIGLRSKPAFSATQQSASA